MIIYGQWAKFRYIMQAKSSCDNMANRIGLTNPIVNVTVSTAPSRGTKTAVSGDGTGTNLQKQWHSHKHYLGTVRLYYSLCTQEREDAVTRTRYSSFDGKIVYRCTLVIMSSYHIIKHIAC